MYKADRRSLSSKSLVCLGKVWSERGFNPRPLTPELPVAPKPYATGRSFQTLGFLGLGAIFDFTRFQLGRGNFTKMSETWQHMPKT